MVLERETIIRWRYPLFALRCQSQPLECGHVVPMWDFSRLTVDTPWKYNSPSPLPRHRVFQNKSKLVNRKHNGVKVQRTTSIVSDTMPYRGCINGSPTPAHSLAFLPSTNIPFVLMMHALSVFLVAAIHLGTLAGAQKYSRSRHVARTSPITSKTYNVQDFYQGNDFFKYVSVPCSALFHP